ncbi:penicillin-binding protein activator [Aliagarivorans taiwanensis]|uniref:penicillin-binding protein activator n=1 Tax=Aliagarivorans taiwanensis TaxID=561966 RepID=UPI0004085118|nr:penicillin-binding protein activator [Aliagarivorans taiwanensis]
MNALLTFTWRAASLATVLFLAACASQPSETTSEQILPLPEFSAPLDQSPEFYLQQARSAEELERFDWQLLAAKAYISKGSIQAGEGLLKDLRQETLTQRQQAGVALVQAQSLQLQGQYAAAIEQLNFDPRWSLPDSYWQSYYQQRAELFQLQNRGIASAEARMSLESYLAGEPQQVNRQLIWQLLRPMTSFTLRSFQEPGNDIKNGWLEIVAINNEQNIDHESLIAELQAWRQEYPEHPALSLISEDMQTAMSLSPYRPEKIAVLLPLSGRYQQNADAIRQGLSAAYLDNKSDVQLSFFDTEQAGMADIYEQLISQGYDFVIGPLLKSHLRELQALSPNLPVLALNDIDSEVAGDYYYFPLSPEEEARQAALYIHEQQLDYPLLVAPGNSLGKRMVEAFDEQWLELSDEPATSVFYHAPSELQGAIQRLMLTSESQARINQLKQVLANNVESEVRSRRDTQAVYLIGDSNQTKLAKPFIDVTVSPFASAPVLLTSSRGYTTAVGDNELNGLLVSEMPWLLDSQSANAVRFKQLWPNADSQQRRLYALGYDAYQLIGKLVQMRHYSDFQQPGLSGNLSLDDDGTVLRQLTWNEYRNGRLVPVQ